jgi:hypothetical protein
VKATSIYCINTKSEVKVKGNFNSKETQKCKGGKGEKERKRASERER